mgnify:CR=1 FL=1
MDKNKKKKNTGFVNLRCSVIVSYLVSIASNILLSIILFLSEHGYQWVGLLLHLGVLGFCILSLHNLLKGTSTNKNILKYKSMTRFYTITIIVTGIFYGIVIVYLFASKQDQDLIYYFTFCIIIYCVFHGLFVSIIRSYIKTMEDRPAKKSTEVKLIDKNLRELILDSQNNNS